MLPRTAITLAATILASGCISTVNIDAEDKVSFANLEASFPIGDDSGKRLRIRASRAVGEFSQTLDADERIRVENDDIRGATEIDGELDLDYFSVAIGRDGSFGDSGDIRSSTYLGVSQPRFDQSVST